MERKYKLKAGVREKELKAWLIEAKARKKQYGSKHGSVTDETLSKALLLEQQRREENLAYVRSLIKKK